MKAAIYNRKSTDTEDKQILSLETQSQYNVDRLNQNRDKLVDTYEESRSAKEPNNRKEFSRLIADIKSGKIEVIYCWKLNRLARNPIDGGEIQWLLQNEIIKMIVTGERVYMPSDNVLMMAVELGMATQFCRDLGVDVKRGMREKAKRGWVPNHAPIGYLNSYGQKGKKYVLKDIKQFDTVRRCWDLLLTGTKTVKEVHRIASKEWGLCKMGANGENKGAFSLSAMYAMFLNPFYYGMFQWDGELWEGKHPPMITEEEYDRAQEILGPRGKPRLTRNKNIYSGLIRCGSCDSAVIVDVKRKIIRSTGREREYRYYRCSKMGKKAKSCIERGSVKGADIQNQMIAEIEKIEIPQAFVEWLLDELKLGQAENVKMEERELGRLQKGYKEANQKVNKLMKRQLDSSTAVSEELFKSMLKELEQERDHAKKLVNDFHATAIQRTTDTVEAVDFAKDLRNEFIEGDRDIKVAILQRIGQSIELREKQLYFRFRKSFSAFKKCNEAVREKLGSIEPLKKPLVTIEKGILDQVIPIWYPGEDSNL